MTEKNDVSTVKEVKQKKVQTKKATTGAWWKSTTAIESSPESSEKKAPPRKPRSRKQSKQPQRPDASSKNIADSVAEQSGSPSESNLDAVPSGIQKKAASHEDGKDDSLARDHGTAGAEKERGAEEKRAKKGRTSRNRKTPAKKVDPDAADTPDRASDQKNGTASEDDDTVNTGKNPETSAAKKPGRRRGRPRKTAQRSQDEGNKSADAEPAAQQAALEDAPAVSADDVPLIPELPAEKEKPKRPPRKRPGRRKKTAAEKAAVSEGKGANDAAQEHSVAIEQVEEESVAADLRTAPEQEVLPGAAEEGDAAAADENQDVSGEGVEEPLETDSDEGESDARTEKGRKDAALEKERKPVIKLLINADEPEECRLALLEDGRLESIHVATSTRTQTKNNIYKAKIVAIEPNLQAAFVDYGTEKNGFLPFSEIHPEYYKEDVTAKTQKYIDQHQWKRLSITDVMEKGREVLVQVVKEEVGKKGANMTTYLSLPGRCVVLMPGSDSTGISRKISGEEKRSQLRDYLLSMGIPEGIGWIVRTASNDITKAALSRDVNYLLKLWEDVKKKGQDLSGVGLIYQDHDHVLRFLREHFDPDIQEILVDSDEALDQVSSFIELLPKKHRKVRCKLHRGARPIFNQYSIEDQIESIYQPKVNLPSGGSIVIDPTEALVAIDVNSGSTQKGQNFEDTIFQANMEAGKELARQLRLRDLGGLVVVDFIDMRSKKNIREVERQVKTAMKRDKAKVDISRISKFGLMQISRQKLGAPIEAGNYRVCGHCKGRGVVRSVETLALYYLRRIHTGASRKMVVQIECRFPLDVAQYLLNNKRHELRELEVKHGSEVIIIADPSLKPADHDIVFHKAEKDDAGQKRT